MAYVPSNWTALLWFARQQFYYRDSDRSEECAAELIAALVARRAALGAMSFGDCIAFVENRANIHKAKETVRRARSRSARESIGEQIDELRRLARGGTPLDFCLDDLSSPIGDGDESEYRETLLEWLAVRYDWSTVDLCRAFGTLDDSDYRQLIPARVLRRRPQNHADIVTVRAYAAGLSTAALTDDEPAPRRKSGPRQEKPRILPKRGIRGEYERTLLWEAEPIQPLSADDNEDAPRRWTIGRYVTADKRIGIVSSGPPRDNHAAERLAAFYSR